MKPTLMLCIPGDWVDRKDFLTRVVKETKGEFMLAGVILAKPSAKMHVELDLEGHDLRMAESFRVSGQGKLSETLLQQVADHRMVAYLHFDISLILERSEIVEFSRLMQSVGGIAVKVESSGVAHDWETWLKLIDSEFDFDWYCSVMTLVEDEDTYYSCGMHHFLLEEVEVPSDLGISAAAELINEFNLWRIVEEPKIGDGHTFSLGKAHRASG
jgi:hypothetical protein